MDSQSNQMVRPRDQDLYKSQDPHLGGEEEHHEKTSVMKKVRAKARKIKDSIAKIGHNNHDDHDDHDRTVEDRDLNEEDYDEDDDESMENPDIHGAPIYDSKNVKLTTSPENTSPLPTSFSDHHHHQGVSSESVDESKAFVPEPETRKVNVEKPIVGLLEDPHSPTSEQTPSNYQTKATHPTGSAEEIGVTPIIRSLNKLNIDEKPTPKTDETKTEYGSPLGTETEKTTTLFGSPVVSEAEKTETEFGSPVGTETGTGTGSHDQFSSPKPVAPSYTEQISAATSAITDRAISAKNAVVTKLGYNKPAEGAGSDLGVGTGEQKPRSPAAGTEGGCSDKGVSTKAYWSDKLKPAEDDKALSAAISDALLPNKATSPKSDEKVTQSEQVTRELGHNDDDGLPKKTTTHEEGTKVETGSGGGGYVDMIKESVGSLLGGFGASTTAATTPTTNDHQQPKSPLKSQGEEVGSFEGERNDIKLHESTN